MCAFLGVISINEKKKKYDFNKAQKDKENILVVT